MLFYSFFLMKFPITLNQVHIWCSNWTSIKEEWGIACDMDPELGLGAKMLKMILFAHSTYTIQIATVHQCTNTIKKSANFIFFFQTLKKYVIN